MYFCSTDNARLIVLSVLKSSVKLNDISANESMGYFSKNELIILLI